MSKWFWNNDKDWVEYDASTSTKLETGFKGGVEEVKVDEQRFVQFVTKDELKNNFHKISSKDMPFCIGIQRRYDDEMKRRIVKRVAPCNKTLFNGLSFYICTGRKKTMLRSKDGKELEDAVKEFGGECVKDLSKDPSYVVLKAGDTASLEEAKKAKLSGHIVNEHFIQYCIKYDKVLSFEKFSKVDDQLTSDDEKEMDKIDDDDEATTEEEEEEEEERDDKKKDDEIPSSSLPPPKKIAKVDDAKGTTPVLQVEKNGVFVGSCVYSQTSDSYPFSVKVLSTNGGSFEGTVTWSTLNNATTKCRGSIDDKGAFKLEEYAIITGEDDIEVPSSYAGTVIGTNVNGIITSSSEAAAFVLIYKKPAHPLDVLRGGATFSGVFKLEIPYTISMKPGDSDIAVIKCTSAVGEFATEARVAKKDDGLEVNEFAEVPGGVSRNVPRSYVLSPSGNSDDGTMKGDITVINFATNASTKYGTAELFMQSK